MIGWITLGMYCLSCLYSIKIEINWWTVYWNTESYTEKQTLKITQTEQISSLSWNNSLFCMAALRGHWSETQASYCTMCWIDFESPVVSTKLIGNSYQVGQANFNFNSVLIGPKWDMRVSTAYIKSINEHADLMWLQILRQCR